MPAGGGQQQAGHHRAVQPPSLHDNHDEPDGSAAPAPHRRPGAAQADEQPLQARPPPLQIQASKFFFSVLRIRDIFGTDLDPTKDPYL